MLLGSASANALVITPVFDSSITGSSNATAIEASINSAIRAMDNLYTNAVTLKVDFTYKSASAGNLLSTSQYFDAISYSTYIADLRSVHNTESSNSVLTTALANLTYGNDANGSKNVAISLGLAEMLGIISSGTYNSYVPVININSNQSFGFTQPVSSSTYDLTGGLEHELNEVLGGGGAGSTLNSVANNVSGLNGDVGPLDLYRYSAAHTASFTTSSSANSYLSVNGGTTSVVSFNQNSSGDFGDFTPNCGSASSGGLLIQNAFNCTGTYAAYTSSSPEATMLQALGWSVATSSSSASVPEPTSISLLIGGLLGFRVSLRKKPATHC
jgi:hypothetical protein